MRVLAIELKAGRTRDAIFWRRAGLVSDTDVRVSSPCGALRGEKRRGARARPLVGALHCGGRMRRLRTALLGVGMVLACTAGIDVDQFECEEAVAHLHECCRDVPVLHCGQACEKTDLQGSTAICLRKASCEALIQSGACAQPAETSCE
jgi:hypothetical protein